MQVPVRCATRVPVALLLAAVAAAACGGGAAEVAGPATAATAPGSATAPAPATAPASATATGSATGSASAPAPAPIEMRAPVPSAMGADLQALGLDPGNLPPIEKLDPRALRGAMKLFARALGVKCADCHVEGDFGAPTRRKKIAAKMWDEFAAKLAFGQDGSPVFCDSCHEGRIKDLDRSDKKALSKWMDAAFVAGMKRRDGKSEECESCHVDWDMTFLSKWGQ
jgi:hypothetical protein